MVAVVGSKKISTEPLHIPSLLSRIFGPLKKYFSAWIYLFSGPSIIQQAFDNARGSPFEVFAPDNRYVFVSSSKHIKEIDSASPEILSLFTATKQMLQPRYTMHGFNWPDIRGAEGVGFIKALRTILTNHLPDLIPGLDLVISKELNKILDQCKSFQSGKKLRIYQEMSRLVVSANAYAFFGEHLAFDEEFMGYASTTTEETFKYAELIRLLPSWAQPLAGKAVLRLSTSQAGMYQALVPIVEQRLNERSRHKLGQKGETHRDCISWITETAPKSWPAYRIVYELIAIWFGSVHGISITITFAIHDLCLHPEYLAPLRKELESEQFEAFKRTGSGLPLLDSFIKESARLSPVESMSGRRQALKPFSFSNGTSVNKGEWVCTPAGAVMHSENHYPEPLEFHGFRFADKKFVNHVLDRGISQPNGPSKLTDVDETWHVWGIGRITCPGRFYASAAMKTILSHIIRNYNIDLLDKNAPRMFTWRSSMVPRHSTMVVLRPRRGKGMPMN
ncbi:hypothetical protein GJ744_012276 [Endocarpon pusillum]|uniref:Cytochrome P450 n=1 Tax=Endocarpon pusillum TaxID=364733 RepID=A0A8H7AEL8_9EURO|nr:hypothetical protein GJ744_012276 [Endocarpon pusillum]